MYSTTKAMSCQRHCSEVLSDALWVTYLNVHDLTTDADEMIAVLEVQISRYDL